MKVFINANNEKFEKISPNNPGCFCKLETGMTVIERQVNILKANGIKNDDIFIRFGKGGIWDTKEIRRKIDIIEANKFFSENNGPSFNADWNIDFNCTEEEYLILEGDVIFDSVVITRLLEKKSKNVLVYHTENTNRGDRDYVDVQNGMVNGICCGEAHYPWRYFSGILKVTSTLMEEMIKCERDRDSILDLVSNFADRFDIEAIDYDRIYYEAIYKGESSELNGGSFSSLKCGVFIIKECRGEGRQKLINEINWLRELPDDVKPYFSKVIEYDIKSENVYYYIPYYGDNNIRENLFKGRFDADAALSFIENILDWMFENVYCRKISDSAEGWIMEKHIKRVLGRLSVCSASSEMFNHIINAKRLVINGTEYKNIRELYTKLANLSDVIELLTPECLVLTHGDTHFQNIIEYPNNERGFMLVDPRGERNGADIYYDIGKFYISCHGKYDFIHTDQYEYDFSLQGRTPICNYKLTNNALSSEYDRIYEKLNVILPKYDMIQRDPNWMLKSLFAEASHNASNAPFHLGKTKDEARSIILYLLGVIQINEFFKIYIPDKY